MFDKLSYFGSFYSPHHGDPPSVSPHRRAYFGTDDWRQNNGNGATNGVSHPDVLPDARETGFDDKLHQLIRNFRVRGHLIAQLDPLGSQRPCPPELKLEYYVFTESELDQLV